MPREQRVALNKPAVAETPLGVVSEKGAVSVGNVTVDNKAAGLGEQLASALNVGMKAATTFAEGKNKQMRAMDSIRQQSKGRAYARTRWSELEKQLANEAVYIEDASGNRVNQHRKIIEFELERMNDQMREQSGEMHPEYYKAVISHFADYGETHAAKKDGELLGMKQEELLTEMGYNIQVDRESGMGGTDIIAKLQQSQLFPTKKAAAKFHFETSIAEITEKAQRDPTYDYQADIDRLLNVSSPDGVVDYKKDPELGKLIDGLESNIKTLRSAQYTASKNAITRGREESDRGLTEYFVTNDPIGGMKHLQANRRFYGLKEYKDAEELVKGIGTRVFAQGISDTEVYLQLSRDIQMGKFNQANLEANANLLTEDDYKKLVQSKIDFDKGMATASAKDANARFNKLLSTGQGEASGVSAFDFDKSQIGARKKNYYTQEIMARQEAFVKEKGWAALTVSQVNTWNDEIMKQINSMNFEDVTPVGQPTTTEEPNPEALPTAPAVTPPAAKPAPKFNFSVFVKKSSELAIAFKKRGLDYETFVQQMATDTATDPDTIRSNLTESTYNELRGQ
jgi:hypothetical protein